MKKQELTSEIIDLVVKGLSDPMKAALLSLPAFGEKLDTTKLKIGPFYSLSSRTVVPGVSADLARTGRDIFANQWNTYCTITPFGVAVRQRLTP